MESTHTKRNQDAFSIRKADEELSWQLPRIHRVSQLFKECNSINLVADLGCMSGMAMKVYQESGAKKLHGFDVSAKSLENVKALGFEGFRWNMDGEVSPAESNSYDVVIAGEVIEHLIDTDHFLKEIKRMLKPGGMLIITTPNLASWYNRIRLLRGKPPRSFPGVSSFVRLDPLIDNNHIRVNVVSEWKNLIQHHGFQIKRIEGISHLEALQGGWRNLILRLLDRRMAHWPTLASGMIFMCQKP